METFTTVTEVERFADGTDSISDQPISFGDGTSSGPDERRFATAPHRRETWAFDVPDPTFAYSHMPIFQKPPLEALTPAKDRWTPIYLEHGRLEVDDSSIKWIGADRLVYRLPVATLSAVLLGPGTTVTHAAMKACATPTRRSAGSARTGCGSTPSASRPITTTPSQGTTPRSGPTRRNARRSPAGCSRSGFPGVDVQSRSINELRGMEGLRVRARYAELGQEYGVTWKGRDYDKSNWNLADNINRALSAANASLYAVCAAVCCSLGYLPSLGFVHDGGTLPFIYDVADLYKEVTVVPGRLSGHPPAAR